MKDKIVIDGRLPSLNDIINKCERHWSVGHKILKESKNHCELCARRDCKNVYEKAHFEFHWYETNRKRDPDNIISAHKMILDGLQQAGKLTNDGWDNVLSIKDHWEVDKENPRIEVYLHNEY